MDGIRSALERLLEHVPEECACSADGKGCDCGLREAVRQAREALIDRSPGWCNDSSCGGCHRLGHG